MFKDKRKRLRLIALRKDDPEMPSVNFVLWFTFMKIILVKHSKFKKKKCKMYGSKSKRVPGSKMELDPVLKDVKWN